MIVAFTGHRPDKLGGYSSNPTQTAIKAEIRKLLNKLQPDKAISGMALGVDQWAAEICIRMKIPVIAAVPFAGQELKWPEESQDRYNWLLSHCEEMVTVCDGGYAAWKMQKRNEWMVDHADVVIAVWDGSTGGTDNCVRYARATKKKVHIIDPDDFKPAPVMYERPGYL